MAQKVVLAVLQNMWDPRPWVKRSPELFQINPENHSGRRLYSLVGPEVTLLVTNASRDVSRTAAEQKTRADYRGLERVLSKAPWDLVLVCGKVAQGAFDQLTCELPPHLKIDHPAARRWSKAKIEETRTEIQALLQGQSGTISSTLG